MDQYTFSKKFLAAKSRGLSDDAAAAEAMQQMREEEAAGPGGLTAGMMPPEPTPQVNLPMPEPQTPAGEVFSPLAQQYQGAQRMVRETAGPRVNPFTGQGMPAAGPQMPTAPNLIRGVDTSRLEGLRSQIDTASEEAAAHGFGEREEALRKITDIDAQRAQIMSDARQGALAEYNQMISDQGEREQRAQQTVDAKLGDYQRATDDYMRTNVDPGRMWGEAPTGAKILAAIGVALGQFGAQATGGRNVALDIINDAINRDLEAQKIKLDKMGRRASMVQNEYNMARQNFSDIASQGLAARKLMLDKVQMQIESELSKSESDRARAVGQQLLGQIELEKTDAISKIRERELGNQFKLESMIIQQKRANVQQWNAAEMAKYQAGAKAAEAGKEKGSPVPGVSFSTDKPSRQQVSAAFSVSQGLKEFHDAAAELRGLKEEVGQEMAKRGPSAVMYGKERYEEIQQKLSQAYKSVTGAEMKIDLSAGASYANEKKIKAALVLVEKEARNKLRNIGADLDLPEQK